MADYVVQTEGLSKRYKLGSGVGGYKRLTETLALRIRPKSRTQQSTNDSYIWALKDVSLDVKAGEVVGIVGRNGAGKTTLLKLLSRITHPTEGTISLRGRVGALLEVGTGFHPELTGRENIYLNGAILGMRRKELRSRFDAIVEFAEVARFIDTPVKRYSSGMYVRLAFAVAAHMEPEVLIIDEVLAVGDLAFQKKCLGKMGNVASEGRTVLFVSHNLGAVKNLCTVGHLLDEGRVVASGDVDSIIENYVSRTSTVGIAELATRSERKGEGKLRFTRFYIEADGAPREIAICGSAATFILEYEASTSPKNVAVSMAFYSAVGDAVLHLSNEVAGRPFETAPTQGAFVCSFDALPLIPGQYDVTLFCTVNGIIEDWVIQAARIQVAEGDFYGSGRLPPPGYGAVLAPHEWRVRDG